MESVISPATSPESGSEGTGESIAAAAMRATLRAFFAGFGIADSQHLTQHAARIADAAQAAGDLAAAPALAERAVAEWFVSVFGGELERAELAADIGRLAALKSGVFARHPEWFMSVEMPTQAAAQLRRAMPEPPTVSLMTPMPTQSLARASFVPSARRALARLQIRRA